ncbi:MAG: SlyX family protein [Phycisphaeraceae bacterium]
MESRIVELEVKLAYQEKTLSDLNDVILQQQQMIERLEKRLTALKEQVEAAGEAPGPHDDPPPHY